MRKLVACAAAVLVIAAGCRAVVGIEDLQRTPPDDQRHEDGGKDGPQGQNDGGGGGGDPSQKLIDECAAEAGTCRPCCKTSFPSLHDYFERDAGGGRECVCGPEGGNCSRIGACNGTELCGNPPFAPTTPGTPDPCIVCFDDALSTAPGKCNSACMSNVGCLAGLRCMQTCPKGGGGP